MSSRLNIVLYAPRIAQNTGQIARTCFAMDLRLHLIRPLGFRIDEASLKRAAVGFWDELSPLVHDSVETFRASVPNADRLFLVTKYGKASYTQAGFMPGDTLVFGNETEGLPAEWIEAQAERTLSIPMVRSQARCLNLAAAAAAVTFEALRQIDAGVG
jgi:tRNA (cytidine/uridine-2'-O-)-methyltransferase